RRFGASLSYSREAEMFARRSSLNTTGAAQSAVGTLTYAGPGGLRLEAAQRYTTTLNPSQLVPTTGLDLGRRSAWQVTSEESLSLPLGIRTRIPPLHLRSRRDRGRPLGPDPERGRDPRAPVQRAEHGEPNRKSTRLNSSHE